VQYLKVFNYLVQYLVFKYYLNSAQSEVFYKVFKYSGQSICPNTVVTNESDTVTKTMRLFVRVDAEAQHACRAGQKCTIVFDILAKSIQYGVFGFTLKDYKSFCL